MNYKISAAGRRSCRSAISAISQYTKRVAVAHRAARTIPWILSVRSSARTHQNVAEIRCVIVRNLYCHLEHLRDRQRSLMGCSASHETGTAGAEGACYMHNNRAHATCSHKANLGTPWKTTSPFRPDTSNIKTLRTILIRAKREGLVSLAHSLCLRCTWCVSERETHVGAPYNYAQVFKSNLMYACSSLMCCWHKKLRSGMWN